VNDRVGPFRSPERQLLVEYVADDELHARGYWALARPFLKLAYESQVLARAHRQVVHDADAVPALLHQRPYESRPYKPAAACDEPVHEDPATELLASSRSTPKCISVLW
jgi:hypothetical protein